jgi:hydrogenase maturation factor
METDRYGLRKNLNIYWTVTDAVTGQAVIIDGVVMDMLTEEEAEELVERLNRKEEEGKPFERP